MKRLISTWFGLGLLRPAPGTWGSAGAVLVWLAAWLVWSALAAVENAKLAPPALWLQSASLAIGAAAAFFLGVPLGRWSIAGLATKRAGPEGTRIADSTAKAEKDPSSFVLDEVAGQWLTLAFLPAADGTSLLVWSAAGFLAFRTMDIAKPWPCRPLERLPHGWGICADDIMAGLYAGSATALLRWVIP
ncbi:MAG: phosphatidylglycerophosphatase A [Planctomycetia bacterium]|nr:phosphatidylglycerophosphatase A [Planctomycetia bacterium]